MSRVKDNFSQKVLPNPQVVCADFARTTSWQHSTPWGKRLLGSGRELLPQLIVGRRPPWSGGWGGWGWEGGFGRGEGGGVGGGRFCLGGGGGPGGLVGWLGGSGGATWGVHAPKAKRWSIVGSLYLLLPSANHGTMLIRLNKIPQFSFMAALVTSFLSILDPNNNSYPSAGFKLGLGSPS